MGQAKLGIDEMQQIAFTRGGECLSDTYINSRTNLVWKCSEEHIWQATPHNIKNGGQWCKICQRQKYEDKRKLQIFRELKALVSNFGGVCLSSIYVDKDTPLKWRCNSDHEFERSPRSIKKLQEKWCPQCSQKSKQTKKKLTVIDMQKFAKNRGGFCLSTDYKDNKSILRWGCKEGHRWSETYLNMHRQNWCLICAGKKSLDIKELQEIAKSRGGKCLSTSVEKTSDILIWQCAKNHVWKARVSKIKHSNQWCRKCAGKQPHSIDEMRLLAASREGSCLSKRYINAETKLKWRCKFGHTWNAVPSSVIKGHWCEICAGVAKDTIENMRKIASSRGGKCISTEYIDNQTPLTWECSLGHRWNAVPASIKRRGSWCGQCSINFSEEICRTYLENLFNTTFPKLKPPWLLNSRGNRMEFDGFSKKLKIAFEYNGAQHFKVGRFSKDTEKLENRMRDDKLKQELSASHNVALIIYTHFEDLTYIANLTEHKLKQLGIDTTTLNFSQKLDFSKVYVAKDRLREMRTLAEKRGGECLSKEYHGSQKKLTWRCKVGHVWDAVPNSIQQGSWCHKCTGITIEKVKSIAQKNGYVCTSKTYVNGDTPLRWQCEKGHSWSAKYRSFCISLKKGRNCCGVCRTQEFREKKLTEMKHLATKLGGKCLSSTYLNAQTKLRWVCQYNHTWMATPNHILHSNGWCRQCKK